MYIITGGAGFIGSVMAWKLNQMGVEDIWIVDTLGPGSKWRNLQGIKYSEIIKPEDFIESIDNDGNMPDDTEAVIHMGACSATTETDADYLMDNNYQFSRRLAEACLNSNIQILVASSAAVYGGGEHGYADDPEISQRLRPLNMYGQSKLMFDQWAADTCALDNMVSLRFFNVYGPNEYHKGDMASMVCKSFHRVIEDGRLNLFRSYLPGFQDGEQMRDFIYVKDVADVMWWFLEHPDKNGLFNIGTGIEETWNQLATALFDALGMEPVIEYIDMPENIRSQYQYRTRADISRLRAVGYSTEFRSVAEGIRDYVVNYLGKPNPYITNDS